MTSIRLDLFLIILLIITIAVAIIRLRVVDTATRIFIGILTLCLLTECIAIAFEYLGKNDLIVYRISNPIELALYCLYFNYSIKKLGRINLGWYFAGISLLLGLGSEVISISNTVGSVYLMLEGLIVISLGIYSAYRMMLDDKADKLFQNIHFWLGTFTSFLWCSSIVGLALYDNLIANPYPQLIEYITRTIWISNVISLTGVLLTFSFNPKARKLYISGAILVTRS